MEPPTSFANTPTTEDTPSGQDSCSLTLKFTPTYHVTIEHWGETLEVRGAPYFQALVTSRGVRENAQKDPGSLGTPAPGT